MRKNFVLTQWTVILALLFNLFPSGTVQAQGPISDPVPQWPVSQDTKVTCVIEFSPEVNKPGNNAGDGSGHEGLDICAAGGTAVYPILPGEIVHLGTWRSLPGNWWGDSVIIKSMWQGKVKFLIYTHLDASRFKEFHLGQWVQQGEPLGYMSPVQGGSAYWGVPHVHVGLFDENNDPVRIEQGLDQVKPTRDPYTQAEVASDYMLIWRNPREILGQNPPKASKVASSAPGNWPSVQPNQPTSWIDSVPTTGQEWVDVVWSMYSEVYFYVTGRRAVALDIPTPFPTQAPVLATPVPAGEETIGTPVVMSISAQSRDLTYQENVRRFYAGQTANKDLSVLYAMDTKSFSGSLVVLDGQTLDVNTEYAWGKYEEAQGMGIPAGMRIGDGNCNAASALAAAMKRAGLEVRADRPGHTYPVPGVTADEAVTVCVSTPAYPCGRDLNVFGTNRLGFPVRINWKVEGDTLTVWVTKVATSTTSIAPTATPATGSPQVAPSTPALPQLPDLPYGWLILAVVVVVFLLILWLQPGWVGKAMVWTMDKGPEWWMIISEGFKRGSRWWLSILAFATVLTPELFHLGLYGFGAWLKGETTISNVTIVILVVFTLLNAWLRAAYYVKEVRTMKGYYIVEKKQLGCLGQLAHLMLSLVLVVSLFAALAWANKSRAQTPVNPPVRSNTPIGDGLPPTVRYWQPELTAWAAKYGKGKTADPMVMAVIMTFESCGRPTSVSYVGAQGLFQVMPNHWPASERIQSIMQNPEKNAEKGYAWLNVCFAEFPNDLERAFGCYNGGAGGVKGPKYSWPAETQKYVSLTVPAYKELLASNGQSSKTIVAWRQPGDSFCNQAVTVLSRSPWNIRPIP